REPGGLEQWSGYRVIVRVTVVERDTGRARRQTALREARCCLGQRQHVEQPADHAQIVPELLGVGLAWPERVPAFDDLVIGEYGKAAPWAARRQECRGQSACEQAPVHAALPSCTAPAMSWPVAWA